MTTAGAPSGCGDGRGTGLAGCATRSPYGVDPSLREAANRFAVALRDSDVDGLTQLAAGDTTAARSLIALRGGGSTVPLAYSSSDREVARVEFTVSCGSGTATFWERFVYVLGTWKPDLREGPSPQEPVLPASGRRDSQANTTCRGRAALNRCEGDE